MNVTDDVVSLSVKGLHSSKTGRTCPDVGTCVACIGCMQTPLPARHDSPAPRVSADCYFETLAEALSTSYTLSNCAPVAMWDAAILVSRCRRLQCLPPALLPGPQRVSPPVGVLLQRQHSNLLTLIYTLSQKDEPVSELQRTQLGATLF